MSKNPKKPAQFAIGANKGIVKMDEDQLSLSAQTGFSLATDADTGIPTTLAALQAEGAVVKVSVRYAIGSKVKTSPIYMTVTEVGQGSIHKLEGKSFKSGVIRSAKIPQKATIG